MLFSHGRQKILHSPAAASVPPIGSLSWIAGLIELTLGFLVLVGFQTRIAAFVLSGLMAFAYFIGHARRAFIPCRTAALRRCCSASYFSIWRRRAPGRSASTA